MNITRTNGHIEFHKKNIMTKLSSSLYEDTLDETSFTCDVIIKTGLEKHEFHCHRMIFAASSEFLSQILATSTPGTIPVILLPDIETRIFIYLLYYIYFGEVHVPLQHYADFVEACRLLELKGPIDQIQPVASEDTIEEENEFEAMQIEITPQAVSAFAQNEMDSKVIKREALEDDTSNLDEMKPINEYGMSESRIEMPDDSGLGENSNDAIPEVNTHTNVRIIRKSFDNLLEVSPLNEMQYRQKLHESLKNVYDRCINLNVDVNLVEKHITDSNLVIVRNKFLLRAEHLCVLCPNYFSIPYTAHRKQLSWCSGSLKRHLEKCHGARFNKIVRGRGVHSEVKTEKSQLHETKFEIN